MILNRIKSGLNLIKFEHTIFALPFAYLGMLLAHNPPGFQKFFWITAAMVGARTAGMTLNRLIDLEIDTLNPRTKDRPMVTGEFKIPWAWGMVAVSAALLFYSASQLNPLCFKLSPVALILLTGYHYVKRFSFICHWVLGAVLGIAPMGGWIGVTGDFAWQALPLSLGVLFWVAGFDILYSLQDIDFDRSHRLHSAPVKFGAVDALKIAAVCHVLAVIFLFIFGIFDQRGILYWVGVLVTAGLLWFEHRLVSESDLSRINTAFFDINSWVGVLLLVFTFLDLFK